MRKFLLLILTSMMTVFAMAIGRNDGSTKANAIDFDWNKGIEHDGGTKWYRVDLAPLYEEENPSLALYLTNPSNVVGSSVKVSMVATVGGETESKEYTIAARQYKAYTANASLLIRMNQTDIYLTLTSDGAIKLSAKVFEASDLDETCKDARTLAWDTETIQPRTYSAWWRVDLKPVKEAPMQNKDAKITITNTGSGEVNLRMGQSLDCPSSGLTKRTFTLAAGASVVDTVPRSMIMSVQPDELYFSVENIEQPVSMKVELINQPTEPVIPATASYIDLHVTDKKTLNPGTQLYRISVAEMRDTVKYEPEFTYRNQGEEPAHVSVKMAFSLPAYGTDNTAYTLAPDGEEVVVYKKNMLEGLDEDVKYFYLLITVDQPVQLSSRFKHIREGKACKTNIDFNWEEGHRQEARTTQWYAIEIAEARDNLQDILVYIQNEGNATATVKASMAFSCPYIDVQEITRTLAANSEPVSRRLGFSSYAMMSDTVWIGLETNQNIRFWAETEEVQLKDPDPACLVAQKFNWEEGALQKADTTVWYKFAMEEIREQSAKFPTIFVQNYGDAPAKITAELSLECPDDIENEKRTMTIAANGSYSKKLSRNLFENIVQDTIFLCVTSTQEIAIQVRLTEKPAGSDCSAAIPFNWVSGNTQDANANLWYKVDLTNVMRRGNDLNFHIENKSNTECNGVAQLAYSCPVDVSPSILNFKLAGKGIKDMTVQNSTFETLEDSVIYINMQATASLHFWADTMAVEPFDTIYANGITLIPLRWDTLYTQTVDTAWYVISQEEIEKVKNLSDKVKPVGHFINLATDSNTVKAEMAFAFPIVKNMITRTKALGRKQRGSDTIPATTFDQVLKKDSIILRLTRRPGAGDFQFRAELVSAYTGNTRYDALPLTFGKQVDQEANTEMWYKIDIKEWKKNPDLHGRSLHFNMRNHEDAAAEITESLYDGLLSEADLFEDFGNSGSRRIGAGQTIARTLPAHMLYGMNDLELYLKVRTTRKLSIYPYLGESEPAPADPNQQKAKLLVPEVDYLMPQDSTVWFRACIEYLKTNYVLTDSTSFIFHHEGNDSAKVIMSLAFQDTVRFKMSERTRMFGQNDTLTYRELTDEMIHKMGVNFSVADTKTEFLDSLIRRFTTDEHVAMQIRMHSSEPLYMRMINAPQIRGQWMRTSMLFDWEHGNVNPQDQANWFRAVITKDRIPEGKDLRLHVTNWSDQPCTATAKIHLDSLPDSKPKSKSYTLAPYEDKWQDIGREALAGSSDLLIDYYSDYTSHIWAEIVQARPRDSVIVDTVLVACDGETLVDPYTSIPWKVNFSDWSTIYRRDSIPFINDTLMAEWDSICYIKVRERIDPTVYEIEEIPVAALPVVTKGAVIDYSAADAWLRTKLDAEKAANDTVKAVETILWECSINNENDAFELISLTTPVDTTAQVLRYRIVTECDNDTLESELYYNTVRDTLVVSACGSYRWIVKNAGGYTVKDKTYTASTHPLDSVRLTLENGCTRWTYLSLTIHHDMLTEEVYDTICAAGLPYLWNEGSYTEAGDYPYTTANAVGCDSTVTLHLTVLEETTGEVYDTICAAGLPYLWNEGSYTEAGDYPYTTTNTAGCDSTVTLHLAVLEETTGEVYDTICAARLPYLWNEGSYTEAGDYRYTTTNAAGCDSTVTLHLAVSEGVTADTTATECNLFTWYGETYYESGDYTYETQTVAGCDSLVTLHLTINNPYTATLELVHKYGDRLLLINRTEINNLSQEWDLDIESDTALVEWYRVASPEDVFLGYGYYLTNIDGDANGDKLQPGQTYYAKIDIPGTDGNCGCKAETVRYTTAAARQTPALLPSLAQPGQEIKVLHLDPEVQTVIRLYTTEGLLQHTYTVSGEESFLIKAADAHGFYLVEITDDNMKSTLRYIVK